MPEPVDAPAVVELLKEKGLWECTPTAVRGVLTSGAVSKSVPRAPLNGLIGANRHLLRAMAEAARPAGFHTVVEETPTTGLNDSALPLLLERWRALALAQPSGALCQGS